MENNHSHSDKYPVSSEINGWVKRIIIAFVIIVFLLILASVIIDYFGLPDKLIFVVLLPYGVFYIYQIYSFTNIQCPKCGNTLFSNILAFPIQVFSVKHCQHCGVKIR